MKTLPPSAALPARFTQLGAARRSRYRALFISDVHRGTRDCRAAMLYDFLAHHACDTLYLVGDIVDGWRLQRRWYWTNAHSRVIDEILKKVEVGTRVIYVPGNHDEVFRPYCGLTLGGVMLINECVHETVDGKRLLVMHGDRFDGIVTHAKWLALLGDRAYDLALSVNTLVAALRRVLGLPYWSLAAYLKLRVKNAASFIKNFENACVHEARARGFDGVVCGHIHQAELKTIDGTIYCNDGDWVESCSALAENMDGHLRLLHWTHPAVSELHRIAPSIAPSRRVFGHGAA